MSPERIVGGKTYSATLLPAMRALKLMARLGKIVGPAMAQVESGEGTVADAAKLLFDRLSEDDVEQVVRSLLETVTVDNRPVLTGFDAAFMGKLDEVVELVRFAMEVQYADFFVALRAAAKPLPAA